MNKPNKKPKIGITLDFEQGREHSYSRYPWYALRENYISTTQKLGGISYPLPYTLEDLDVYVNDCDGFIITGGAFDVPPHYFGDATQHQTVTTKDTRTAFEFCLIEKALQQNKPVLGICGGAQILNVVLGGTLIQHIPDSIPQALEHEQKNPRHEAGHTIQITKDTQLYTIAQKDQAAINSAHHQAVKTVGDNVIINAYAPDGVIEGIEHPGYQFCLGVQWHPEFLIDSIDYNIFAHFIKVC